MNLIPDYSRGVLRYTLFGNSPTKEITSVITGWADCK